MEEKGGEKRKKERGEKKEETRERRLRLMKYIVSLIIV